MHLATLPWVQNVQLPNNYTYAFATHLRTDGSRRAGCAVQRVDKQAAAACLIRLLSCGRQEAATGGISAESAGCMSWWRTGPTIFKTCMTECTGNVMIKRVRQSNSKGYVKSM
jgi:hypothetical protein